MADEDLTADVVDAGAIDASEQVIEPEELTEVDELAVELGWRPKSEWTGPEDKWTDSRTFLRTTREMNRTMSRELKDFRKQLDGIGRATSKMTSQALDQQRRELLTARDEAFEQGDRTTYDKVNQAIERLADAPDDGAEMTSEGREWAEKHAAWFGKDKEATDYAAKRATKYAKDGLSPARQLAAVEKDMKAHFPDLFAEEKPAAVNTQPTLARPQRVATPAPREKGYPTLPTQARKACDDWASSQKENNNWDERRTAAMKAQWATNYYAQEA